MNFCIEQMLIVIYKSSYPHELMMLLGYEENIDLTWVYPYAHSSRIILVTNSFVN